MYYANLLVIPEHLSADYSYNAIPAVQGLDDPRCWHIAFLFAAAIIWIAVVALILPRKLQIQAVRQEKSLLHHNHAHADHCYRLDYRAFLSS